MPLITYPLHLKDSDWQENGCNSNVEQTVMSPTAQIDRAFEPLANREWLACSGKELSRACDGDTPDGARSLHIE